MPSFLRLLALSGMACVRAGLLALPLCGAAPTFFAAAKKVGKESSYPQPKHFMPAAAQNWFRGSAVASALTKLAGLGSRTIRLFAPQILLVQPLQAPARFAADRSIEIANA